MRSEEARAKNVFLIGSLLGSLLRSLLGKSESDPIEKYFRSSDIVRFRSELEILEFMGVPRFSEIFVIANSVLWMGALGFEPDSWGFDP